MHVEWKLDGKGTWVLNCLPFILAEVQPAGNDMWKITVIAATTQSVYRQFVTAKEARDHAKQIMMDMTINTQFMINQLMPSTKTYS